MAKWMVLEAQLGFYMKKFIGSRLETNTALIKQLHNK